MSNTLLTLADHEIDEIRAEGNGRLLVVDEDSTVPRRYLYQIWSPQPPTMLLTNGQAEAGPLASFEQLGLQTQNLGGEGRQKIATWRDIGRIGRRTMLRTKSRASTSRFSLARTTPTFSTCREPISFSTGSAN